MYKCFFNTTSLYICYFLFHTSLLKLHNLHNINGFFYMTSFVLCKMCKLHIHTLLFFSHFFTLSKLWKLHNCSFFWLVIKKKSINGVFLIQVMTQVMVMWIKQNIFNKITSLNMLDDLMGCITLLWWGNMKCFITFKWWTFKLINNVSFARGVWWVSLKMF